PGQEPGRVGRAPGPDVEALAPVESAGDGGLCVPGRVPSAGAGPPPALFGPGGLVVQRDRAPAACAVQSRARSRARVGLVGVQTHPPNAGSAVPLPQTGAVGIMKKRKCNCSTGNVHRFDSGSPGTKVREDLGLAVHGESFARGAVPHNLAEGYPSARSGLFNVGLLHTSLNGRPGHDRYAPCTVEQLANHGYQYWALGHVHHRAIEHSDGPYVVFPGNTQGRDAGETGPKGCTLVTVEDLQVLGSPEHHDLDSSARWHEVRVDMADVEDLADACVQVEEQLTSQVVDRAQPGQANAVRVVAFGPSEAHTALVRGREDFTNAVRRIGQEHPSVWIEKV